MAKKYTKKLFLLFIFIFIISIAWTNYSYALEIEPKDWPKIPFTQPITNASTLPNYIIYFFALGIYISGALAVISLAVAGIQLILSAENPDNRNHAIERIRGSFIGLIILLGSFIIIGTINPQLQTINLESLKQVGGLQLVGANDKSRPADMNAYTLDVIKKDYSAIYWPENIQDTAKKPIKNCDPKLNEVYVIYWYADKNFKDFFHLTRLKCGERTDFGGANSYVIVKEQPGVYFFRGADCKPEAGSDSSQLPFYANKSIPQRTTLVSSSILVVNGLDRYKGPFFGVIAFDEPDYRSSYSLEHVKPSTAGSTRCVNTPGWDARSAVSIAIYKWAGFKADRTVNSDTGITLHSRPSWTGGSLPISAVSNDPCSWPQGVAFQIWDIDLNKAKVCYQPTTTIPLEEQKQCSTFNPKYTCLLSFEIKGNFLVLVSNLNLKTPAWNKNGLEHYGVGKAQMFPISPRIAQAYDNRPEGYSIERGTPELASDFITSGNAYYMEIIPLAENLVGTR